MARAVIRLSFAAVGLVAGLSVSSALAKDWAMVVGINDYQHFLSAAQTVSGFTDLEGAENDAKAITRALRSVGVDLPASRVLIDSDATLENFIRGWSDLTAQAAPGDTIIVSYAGHGGQEVEFAEPFDEQTDGKDETLMFHDFDPKSPTVGRINDDQLQEMLKAASAFNVIWVMDSCHSAGLERSVNQNAAGLSRGTSVAWEIPLDDVPDELLESGEGDGERQGLAHVTQILATATEDRLVQETAFDNVKHGALSYYFAKGIGGEADTDSDGAITRAELEGYVEDRVFTHMEGKQQPTFLPRGDNALALSLAGDVAIQEPAKVQAHPLLVQVIGARPQGLEGDCPTCLYVTENADVTFENTADGWQVFNKTGDLVTTITGDVRAQLLRQDFLNALNRAKRSDLPPVGIDPMQSAEARQRIGTQVGWSFSPPTPQTPYLTLFNIASDGTVQYGITPPGFREDEPTQNGLLVRFAVAPPTGVDQLVAIYCNRPPRHLHDLLGKMNGRTLPDFDEILEVLGTNTCQFGRIGLFTEG